jgi:hypothetical protein
MAPHFSTPNGHFEAKALQTDRITFATSDIDTLKSYKATIVVFSLIDEPIAQIPVSEIDFENKRWKNIKVYTIERKEARSIGLTASQYSELERTKQLFENDFGRPYSFGDLIHTLCMGYVHGRQIIFDESQPLVINESPTHLPDA